MTVTFIYSESKKGEPLHPGRRVEVNPKAGLARPAMKGEGEMIQSGVRRIEMMAETFYKQLLGFEKLSKEQKKIFTTYLESRFLVGAGVDAELIRMMEEMA